MTYFYLPEEPKTDRLWTIEGDGPDPEVFEWHRDINSIWWSTTPGLATCTWPELLKRGAVSDHHPDLPDDAPLPWSWDDVDGVVDAKGLPIGLADEVAGFVVRAVNAYAERIGGIQQ